jgi:hypothetical protein
MQKFTNTPILIAVYENKNDSPNEDSIYMFSINNLMSSKTIEKRTRKGIGECYRIPLSFTTEGFSLIDETYKSLIKKPTIPEFIEIQRQKYRNAYSRWTEEDDKKLEMLYCEGQSINELSKLFERNNGAIRARIKKLELTEKVE